MAHRAVGVCAWLPLHGVETAESSGDNRKDCGRSDARAREPTLNALFLLACSPVRSPGCALALSRC